MSIQHAIWTVDNVPVPLRVGRLPNEQTLEDMIVRDPRILSSEWMLVGRQEATTHGGRVDLLAIAPDGSLVLVELKRDRTPREIIAQALDYASWVESLGAEKIAQIYQRFTNRNLDEDFRQRFGAELDEETLNQSHQIVSGENAQAHRRGNAAANLLSSGLSGSSRSHHRRPQEKPTRVC